MQLSLGERPPVSDPKATVGAAGRSTKPQWFGGLRRLFESRRPSPPPAVDSEIDALSVFPSEGTRRFDRAAKGALGVAPARKSAPRFVRLMVSAVAVVALVAAVVFTIRRFPLPQFGTTAERSQPGKLTIDTRLVTAEVLVDGDRRGVTPLTLSLTPGAHTITVRTESDERVVPLTIVAGAEVSQYFDMKTAAASSVAHSGQVSVTTDPPGARVAVDGRVRGISPLTVSDLTADSHKITVTSDAGSAERTVSVAAGSTAAIVFSLSKTSGPVGGWLSISAPFEFQVAENDDVIGSSGTSRIMLAAGHHNLTLTNSALGYQESRRVDISPGKTSTVWVEPPNASVNVNARPWAEILLDGRSVGQTPIANLLVSIGTHDVLFRHPQLGERKQTVVVSLKGPNRIAADLTK